MKVDKSFRENFAANIEFAIIVSRRNKRSQLVTFDGKHYSVETAGSFNQFGITRYRVYWKRAPWYAKLFSLRYTVTNENTPLV